MAKSQRQGKVDIASIDGLDDVFASTVDISTVDSGQPNDPGWSLPEAAKSLSVTERTLRRWIKEGRIQAWKVDGPRGPEWRIKTGSNPSTVDNTRGYFTSTVDTEPYNSSLFELLQKLQSKLDDAQEQLKGASYRNGYLESENKNYQKQVLLLPDLESEAKRAQQQDKELQEIKAELDGLKGSWWYRLSQFLSGKDRTCN